MQTGRLLRLSKGLRLVQRPLTIYMLESASSENLIQTVYNPNPSAHLKVPNMKAPPKRGVFKNEDEVMIFGLKTQKQYNGICAKILKCYPEKKAFKVQTELGRNMVSHNNLMLAHFVFDAGDEVKLHNLKNQNELNGSIVKVISFDEKEHKYVVQTKTGKFKVDSKFVTLHAKKLAHFVFDQGDEVKLHNLKNQNELNGSIAKVISFVEKEHKYVVQTKNGKFKVDSKFFTLHAKKTH